MPDPLVTVAELQTYIQRPIDAAAAGLAIESASAVVRGYCGWDLTQTDEVFKLNGNNSRVLSLPTMHLLTVDEVLIDGAAVTNYRWAQRGQLYRADAWPDYREIQVTCRHGYEPIPDVVKVVALGYAARQVGNPERFKTAAVGSISRTFDLTVLDENLLFPYRLN